MLLRFPRRRRHGRSSRPPPTLRERAASLVNLAAVRDALRDTDVAKSADHHSELMLSRRHILLMADAVVPMSSAIASCEAQSAITSRNDAGPADMDSVIGRFVLTDKDVTSFDCGVPPGDNRRMNHPASETEETHAFIGRVRAAREAKFSTQKPVYSFLGIPQDQYKHYEIKRPLPRRYIPKFCVITEVSMEWLLTGEGRGPQVSERPREAEPRTRKPRRGKAA